MVEITLHSQNMSFNSFDLKLSSRVSQQMPHTKPTIYSLGLLHQKLDLGPAISKRTKKHYKLKLFSVTMWKIKFHQLEAIYLLLADIYLYFSA